jgi:hypothetical protein
MSGLTFEFLKNLPASAVLKDRESHERDQSAFHLLLNVESRLRKQAREESKFDYARRRIFEVRIPEVSVYSKRGLP